jgi:hypothetical protein
MHAQEVSGYTVRMQSLASIGEPLTIEKDGEVIDVYIMDSEGLGGVDKNQNYDIKVFSLSILLSSFFVYNSIGVIDEVAISNLSYL